MTINTGAIGADGGGIKKPTQETPPKGKKGMKTPNSSKSKTTTRSTAKKSSTPKKK